MKRWAAIWATAAAAGCGFLGVAQAQRARFIPYVEVQEVIAAALGDDDRDVLTYTAIAAGVDATVQKRRVQAQASYRYEHRFGTSGDLSSSDVHSGLAAARYTASRNVALEAGALATRARNDFGGDSPGLAFADSSNLSQVFAGYGGVGVTGRAGPVALNGSYRLGYVAVDTNNDLVFAPGERRRLDRYTDSVSQQLTASAGMAPGRLPFGWTVGAGYDREDADLLNQRFEAAYLRGDVVVPVSPTFALTGGVGYETIRQSQQDFRRGANGLPLLDARGRLVADPSARRLRAVDIDGVIYDGGFIWRPTRRTEVRARAGHRYGGTTAVGSLRHQIDPSSSVSAVLYDGISSFGRGIVTDLRGIPTDFTLPANQLIGGPAGCVFGGTDGGVCFDDSLQSITAANFRNRGVNLLYGRQRGVWTLGLGANYARRKYLTPEGSDPFGLAGVTDESAGVQGSLGRRLTRTSGLNFDAYGQWNDSNLAGFDDLYAVGATGTYYRAFTERLRGQASLGLYNTLGEEFDSTVASALLGLRYSF